MHGPEVAWLAGEGWEALSSQVMSWRAQGLSLVTTNGCFDGIQAGHVALLQDARARGDRLIVGVNDDDSTRKLKGAERPRHSAIHRAMALAALRSVDAVVVYSDLLPLRFLEAIRPDVHCKGGDYAPDRLPETALVTGWGGSIHISPLLMGVATTHSTAVYPGVDERVESVLIDILGAANAVRQVGFAHALKVASLGERLARDLCAGRSLLACGNGGSAADAGHLAAELVGRFSTIRGPLSARSLCADGATLTALANDFGYAEVFARQVEAFGKAGDILFAISTSGRSKNVLRAMEVGRSRGLYVVALTGPDPGPMASWADCMLSVPAADVAWIQQGHRALLHALCRCIDAHMETR